MRHFSGDFSHLFWDLKSSHNDLFILKTNSKKGVVGWPVSIVVEVWSQDPGGGRFCWWEMTLNVISGTNNQSSSRDLPRPCVSVLPPQGLGLSRS